MAGSEPHHETGSIARGPLAERVNGLFEAAVSPEAALRMREETGCAAVMIGRAAASNPWIFRQMAEFFATGAYREAGDAAGTTTTPTW